MTERAELMRIYRSNGISSISLMRDHYNKHDNGGDIQPSDATFRATLTNPVNSYRSNAPAGIGDAAITKATGLLNPITAATLTAAPLGAISKINAAAKAYKAAKIANPIIASTIEASSTSAGLAGYLDSRPDKKLSRDIEDKNYVGVASDLVEGVTEGLTAISPLRVIDTKGVKKITRPLKKQLTRILRPGDIKVGDNKLSSREAAASLESTRLMWSLREGDINQKEFINKARNTFGYKGIEGTYYYNSIPPRSERVLYESPKVNKVYEASTFNQTLPVKESDLFITQRGEGSVPYIFKRLQKENPSAVGEAIQQLTTLEQSRRDRIQEAARYYQNIQDRAKIGATVAGAGLGAYGIYKAIDSKKAFGGNIYDGKGTKSNQMNVSFPYKINPENISSSVDDYRYHAPEYIDNNTSLKEDTKRERLSKFIQAYNINHNNWKEPYTDSLINISKDKNIEPEDLAKVIASESSFDYTQKNSESTAYGLIQETQPNLSQRYKDDPEYKEKVMAEYLNKNRRVEDQFHDIRIELDEIKRLTKGRKLTAGDIKYNLLAPHSNRANLISETSWKNLTKKQKDSLTFGKSTYQDYIDLFNRQMERAFKEKTE